MEQKAFDLIAEKVEAALAEQEFTRRPGTSQEENGEAVLYTGENVAYSVLFNKKQKRFELRTCPMTEDGPSNSWKNLSTWLFDPDTDDLSAAQSIVNDFTDTIRGPKRMAAVQQTKKKAKKADENNPDPVFFLNRMVAIFPELKAEMQEERVEYGEVRPLTFTRAKLVPKVEALATQYPDSEPFKKMCGVLNDLYAAGDMDTRSIITIAVLNGINDEKALDAMAAEFSADLRKTFDKSRHLKGKTFKPEKKKKMPSYNAEAMSTLRK